MAAPIPVTLTMPDGTVRSFSSLTQACEALKVPLKRTIKRIHYYGWPLEKAFDLVPHEQRIKPIAVTMRDGTVKTFASLREGCRVLGLAYLLAYRRLARGWTLEQALGIEPAPRRSSPNSREVIVKFGGRTYRWPSVTQAATANGLTQSAVKQRIGRGLSLAQALGLEDSGRPPHKTRVEVIDKGMAQTFESLTKAAEAYGLPVDLVLQRLRKLGWSIEEALSIKPRPGHADRCYGFVYLITHVPSGRQYVGQTKEASVEKRWEMHVKEADTASKTKLRPLIESISTDGPQAFRHRQLDKAHSQDELNAKEILWITTLDTRFPKGFNATRGGAGLESGKKVVLGEKSFKSLSAACRHFGVPLSSAARWVRKGTPEQAFGLQPKPNRRSSRGQSVEFSHRGTSHQFKSIREAAAAHGIPEKKLQRRLKNGWTIQEALDLVKRPEADQEKPMTVRIGRRTVTYPSQSTAARSHGLSPKTLQTRLTNGWSDERALLTPTGKQGGRRGSGDASRGK